MKRLLTSRFPLVIRAFALAGMVLPFGIVMHFVWPLIVQISVVSEWRWVVIAVMVFQILLLVILILRLKDIWIDENFLYLTTMFRNLEIPLEAIASVTENTHGRITQIKIIFARQTGIGSSLTFVPYFSFRYFQQHPAVEEIRQFVKRKERRMQDHHAAANSVY